MTESVQIAVIGAASVVAVAALNGWSAMQAAHYAKATKEKLDAVELKVDGRLSQLLEQTKVAAHKEGELARQDFIDGNKDPKGEG